MHGEPFEPSDLKVLAIAVVSLESTLLWTSRVAASIARYIPERRAHETPSRTGGSTLPTEGRDLAQRRDLLGS